MTKGLASWIYKGILLTKTSNFFKWGKKSEQRLHNRENASGGETCEKKINLTEMQSKQP